MKTRKLASKSACGFTLLEVLLAVTILAMISLAISAGLSTGVRAWRAGERDLDLYQRKRILYDRLRREISGAINVRGKQEDETHYQMIFDGTSDTLSFVSTSESMTFAGFPMGLKEITISAESGEGLIVREAIFSNTDFFSDEKGYTYILDSDVTEIKFRYFYYPRPSRLLDDMPEEGEWVESWGPEHIEIEESMEEVDGETRVMNRELRHHLPLAVEVTLVVLDQRSGEEIEWAPMIIPLKETRVLGVTMKRRER
ncbi:prepilin-type N-terminal cleavage/methylation domain-containing protein [bacterium]|nr:prepilin-type N-terminal cleavage/methylation domain-containing protein [candidate division CSSED10-310 bacterium]